MKRACTRTRRRFDFEPDESSESRSVRCVSLIRCFPVQLPPTTQGHPPRREVEGKRTAPRPCTIHLDRKRVHGRAKVSSDRVDTDIHLYTCVRTCIVEIKPATWKVPSSCKGRKELSQKNRAGEMARDGREPKGAGVKKREACRSDERKYRDGAKRDVSNSLLVSLPKETLARST